MGKHGGKQHMGRRGVALIVVAFVAASAGVAALVVGTTSGHVDRPVAAVASMTRPVPVPSLTPAGTVGPVIMATPSPTHPVTAPTQVPVVVPKLKPTQARYVVRRGDNLTVIARWFHETRRQLYTDNKAVVGLNWNRIYPGQVYRLQVRTAH